MVIQRKRASTGHVPTPAEIVNARGELSQCEASALVYSTQARWSNYEVGRSRMHPAMWELFKKKMKIK